MRRRCWSSPGAKWRGRGISPTAGVGSQASLDQVRRDEERQLLAVEQRRLEIRGHESRRKQVEAKLARATAQQARAMLDLERTRVYPPFEGRITEVFVSPGDRVRPGDRLLAMFDTGTLELRAQIPIRRLPVVRAALERGETLDARAVVDGREIRAVLHRLTAQVDPGSGGADGLFRVTEGNAWLQIGRTVEIILDLPPIHDAVAVPREALYGTDRVFVLDGERMKGVEVERVGEIHAGDGDGRLIPAQPAPRGLRPADRDASAERHRRIEGEGGRRGGRVASAGSAGRRVPVGSPRRSGADRPVRCHPRSASRRVPVSSPRWSSDRREAAPCESSPGCRRRRPPRECRGTCPRGSRRW